MTKHVCLVIFLENLEWLAIEGCLGYQEDSPSIKLRKPSAPFRMRCSLSGHREFCPGRLTDDYPSGRPVLQGGLQTQHLFSSLCIIGKFFIKRDTMCV